MKSFTKSTTDDSSDTTEVENRMTAIPLTPVRRAIYSAVAYVSIIMGVIGLFLPLIPTTPFLLLALFLLTKSNQKMAQRLLNNRFLGVYIRSYVKRQKLPLRDKVRMILLVWVIMGINVVYVCENIYVRIALIIIALIVTVHIAMLRTRKHDVAVIEYRQSTDE